MNLRASRLALIPVGLSAGVAIWTGWVGLGEMVGFGPINPLPGIADVQINTAITLPIGIEAYAVMALATATTRRTITPTARRFAWISAILSLLIGMAGQAAYHVMEAQGIDTAHWAVIVAVSSLPVIVLGMASVLWHLSAHTAPDPVPTPAPAQAPDPAATRVARTPRPTTPQTSVSVRERLGVADIPAPTTPVSHNPPITDTDTPPVSHNAPITDTTTSQRRGREVVLAAVAADLAAHPDRSAAERAEVLDMSVRTLYRYLAQLPRPTQETQTA
jgi:hypothetical protein